MYDNSLLFGFVTLWSTNPYVNRFDFIRVYDYIEDVVSKLDFIRIYDYDNSLLFGDQRVTHPYVNKHVLPTS